MKKRRIAALLFVGALFVACGTDDTDPTPEPIATEGNDAGGGMMDDDDLDY